MKSGNSKQYAAGELYEKKLTKVMERLGVITFNYNWDRFGCFIEFRYKNDLYRFDHTIEKARARGIDIKYGSDVFAQVVLALEDLARMVERGIYDLSTWVSGMKYLPPPTNKVFNERKTTMAEKQKISSGKTGPCFNCGRTQFICDKNGFCTTCHNSVKGILYGTPAYPAALADIKARVNDPAYRQNVGIAARACRKNQTKNEPDTKKVTSEKNARHLPPNGQAMEKKTDADLKEKLRSTVMPLSVDFEKHTKPVDKITTTRNHASASISIDHLIADLNYHQDMIIRLNKAIEILSA
jgi:hypothetical protein